MLDRVMLCSRDVFTALFKFRREAQGTQRLEGSESKKNPRGNNL